MQITRDQLFMPPELWGSGARLPIVPDDGQVIVSDRGQDAPPGQRYAVLGFDPDTTERYWRSRPKGERHRLGTAAAERHGKSEADAAAEGADRLLHSGSPGVPLALQPEPEPDNAIRVRIGRDTAFVEEGAHRTRWIRKIR
jgi:hypothetical protein